MSVLVVLEQRGGKWNRMSFEALAAAEKVSKASGKPVRAAVLGAEVDALAQDAAAYPVDKVVALDHPLLAQYTPDGYTAALEQFIKAVQPAVIVFPHTYQVRDYAPKLSTRFGKPLISDVVDVRANGSVAFVR